MKRNKRLVEGEHVARWNGVLVFVALLGLLGLVGCGSSATVPKGSFHGTFDAFGSGSRLPTVDFVISDNGEDVASFSVSYQGGFGWGQHLTTTTLPDTGALGLKEQWRFKPDKMKVLNGKFSFSRTEWPASGPATVSQFAGEFVSASRAVGTVTIVDRSGGTTQVVGTFTWTATAVP